MSMHQISTPRLWSIRRVAERWCCSKSKVYQLINPGDGRPARLPTVKLDGMIRIRNEDLERFEADHFEVQCLTPTGSGDIADDGSPSSATAKANAAVRLVRIAREKLKSASRR